MRSDGGEGSGRMVTYAMYKEEGTEVHWQNDAAKSSSYCHQQSILELSLLTNLFDPETNTVTK